MSYWEPTYDSDSDSKCQYVWSSKRQYTFKLVVHGGMVGVKDC